MSETVRQAKTLLERITELKTRLNVKHTKLDKVEDALREFLEPYRAREEQGT